MQAQHLSRDSGGADSDDILTQGPTGRVVPSPTASTQLSQDAYQRMLRLLARMMSEHLNRDLRTHLQPEVSDE
jgi:hypothetical protein